MRHGFAFFASLWLILFLTACDKHVKPAANLPPEVICVKAVKQEVSRSFEYIGQTVAEDSVSIVPMVEGYLITQCFDEGSMVKKGDLLFEIDPRPFEAAVQNAEGQLASAEAQLLNANIQYGRYSVLIRESATSQQDQDRATMNKGSAEGQLLVAKANLETARINLGYTKLRAPFDGKISVCPISVGNLVGPGSKNLTLTTIMRMNPMKVEFNVPETAVANVIQRFGNLDKVCKAVVAKIVLPNGSRYPHDGAIYFTDNQITADTGTIKQRARFPNPDSVLTPNEYVKIQLTYSVKQSAVLIPQKAVVEDMTGTLAMVVKDGKVERHLITTGQNHGTDIEVFSGLAEGDWVVTEGLVKIRNGMAVNAKLAVLPTAVPAKE